MRYLGNNVVGTIVPEFESTGRDLRAMIEDIGVNPDRYLNNVNENMLRSGERVWVSWTNKPVFGKNGRIMEILCIGNDITQRKQTEEALRQSEEQFRTLVESAPDAIFITGARTFCLLERCSYPALWGGIGERIIGPPYRGTNSS